jgi:hypothetical protein
MKQDLAGLGDSEPRIELRSRYRGWLYCGIAFLFVATGVVAGVGTELRLRKRRAEAIANAVEILDRDYQTCTLGTPVRDDQLGQRAILAELAGRLTEESVRACRARSTTALDALNNSRDDDHTLDEFRTSAIITDGGYTSPQGFGVCDQIRQVRKIARDLGMKSGEPSCTSHFDTLAPTFAADEVVSPVAHGDELVIDFTLRGTEIHVLRWTRDGVSWKETAPLSGWPLPISRAGVFGISRVEDVARYQLLTNMKWHAGARVLHGEPQRARLTRAGWTLINEDDDGATVVRLDDRMDRILETTSIPALKARWSYRSYRSYLVDRLGFIDAEGNATAIRVADSADHIDFEAHRVAVGGKPELVASIKLDGKKNRAQAVTCQTATMMYVVIGEVGVVASSDGGMSFKTLANSEDVDVKTFTCAGDHLYAAGVRGVTTCDRTQCRTAPLPFIRRGSLRMDLQIHDQKPQLLVTTNGFALLFDVSLDSPDLTLASAWAWHDYSVVASVRIDGTWFVLRRSDD